MKKIYLAPQTLTKTIAQHLMQTVSAIEVSSNEASTNEEGYESPARGFDWYDEE